MLRRRAHACWIAGGLALSALAGCYRHHGAGEDQPTFAGQPAPAAGRGTATAGAPSLPGAAGTVSRGSCALPDSCFTAHDIASGSGLLHAADMDGDGELDLIATGIGAGGTWVELGAGGQAVPHPLEYTARGLVGYGDVTRDGLADQLSIESIACGDCQDYLALHRHAGDGTGSFGEAVTMRLCEVGFSSWHLWAADLDGDGDMEFLLDAACDGNGEELRVIDPFFTPRLLGHTVEALTTGDIDRDGYIDVVGVEHRQGQAPQLVLLRGQGDIQFHPVAIEAPLPEGHGRTVQLLDADADGFRDIAVLGGRDGAATTWLSVLRWSGGQLETALATELDGNLTQLAVIDSDRACGDELIAFGTARDRPGTRALHVDPATGDSNSVQFPASPGLALNAVLSIPAASGGQRLFAQSSTSSLLELRPIPCGPQR